MSPLDVLRRKMKYVTAIALILLGLVWLFFSVPDRPAGETRALSHAIEFEYKLQEWMMAKEAEGKLDESDIREVFTESGAIKFGGENPEEDFRSMVKGIASDSILPSTP